jgi:hypothetical protein
VVDCLVEIGTDVTVIIGALVEVGVKTARRDPEAQEMHLEVLALALTQAARAARYKSISLAARSD